MEAVPLVFRLSIFARQDIEYLRHYIFILAFAQRMQVVSIACANIILDVLLDSAFGAIYIHLSMMDLD